MSNRYAICIGVNKYFNNPAINLSYARSDAEEVAKILKDTNRGGFNEVIELFDERATKESIRTAIDKLLHDPRQQPDDLILLFFAGHGIRDMHGDLCLVPSDFSIYSNGSFNYSSMLHSKEIELSVNNSRVKNIIILIDSCHSGALGRIVDTSSDKENFNLFIIGGSQSKEYANEYETIKHGVFTQCLLQALDLPPLHEEWISLAQVVSFIPNELKKYPQTQLIEATTRFVDLNVPIARNPNYSTVSKSFTGTVKRIFQIANYTVHLAPISYNYPNLFIAEMQAGFQSTRTAVLCLDDKERQVNIGKSHVELFISLIRQLRIDGEVEKGILVTKSDLLKPLLRIIIETGFASSRTYDNLLCKIIDFDSYLHRLIDNFDKQDSERPNEPALGKYFVDLKAKPRDVELIVEDEFHETLATGLIYKWIYEKREKRKVVILGEYGSGKTSLCQKIAHDMAKAYLQILENPQETAQMYLKNQGKERHRIPVIIPLREFPKGQADIEIFISGHLARRCRVANPSFEAFKVMNDAGFILLILDGFDEMVINADADIIQANLALIEQLTSSPQAKVLLTSRPEYFLTSREEQEAFNPEGLLARHQEYTVFDLLPFSEEDICKFLKKKIPLLSKGIHNWLYYYETIKNIHDLTDLSQRPVMLEMITKTLPELITQNLKIDRPTLYETYLNGEIQRQSVEKRRGLLIKRPDRFTMIQELASYLYTENLSGMPADEVQILVYDKFTPKQREELEAHTRDFLTCSFLVRRGDKYSFSHRSFMEFLTARSLIEEIRKNDPIKFGKQLLTREVIDFMLEIGIIEQQVLLQWIYSTAFREFEAVKYLGSNAITILCKLNWNFSNSDLSGTILRGASLVYGEFTSTQFVKADLSLADFAGAELNWCNFEQTDLTKTKFKSASISLGKFQSSILDQTDFDGAILSGADFRNCLNYKVNFADVLIDNGRLDGIDPSGIIKGSPSLWLVVYDIIGHWREFGLGGKGELKIIKDLVTRNLIGTLRLNQVEITFNCKLGEAYYSLHEYENYQLGREKIQRLKEESLGTLSLDKEGNLLVKLIDQIGVKSFNQELKFCRV